MIPARPSAHPDTSAVRTSTEQPSLPLFPALLRIGSKPDTCAPDADDDLVLPNIPRLRATEIVVIAWMTNRHVLPSISGEAAIKKKTLKNSDKLIVWYNLLSQYLEFTILIPPDPRIFLINQKV